MAEILAGGGIQRAFKELGIQAKRTYQSSYNPPYEVWELSKNDLKILDEVMEWPENFGWYRHSKGSNNGTACEFFTVKGQFMIGWATRDGKDTYDTLMDYLGEGLGIFAEGLICSYAVDLARANGKTLSGLFEVYEGQKFKALSNIDRIVGKFLVILSIVFYRLLWYIISRNQQYKINEKGQ